MSNESRLNLLIAKAGEKAGSYYKLSKIIGYTESDISSWKAKRTACPIEAQALMAEVAGLNAEEVTLYAIIERAAEKNPKRGELLARALGKGLGRMSAAASCITYASVNLGFEIINTMYIM
jgi:hypothetical protein